MFPPRHRLLDGHAIDDTFLYDYGAVIFAACILLTLNDTGTRDLAYGSGPDSRFTFCPGALPPSTPALGWTRFGSMTGISFHSQIAIHSYIMTCTNPLIMR